jgi:hypothetical protein
MWETRFQMRAQCTPENSNFIVHTDESIFYSLRVVPKLENISSRVRYTSLSHTR